MLYTGLHRPETIATFVSQYDTKTLTVLVTIPLLFETAHVMRLNKTDLPLALLLPLLRPPLLLLLPLLQLPLLVLLNRTANITTAVD